MNNYTTAVMVLAHRNIDYIIEMASKNPDVLFIIHYDKKEELDLCEIKERFSSNLHFIEDRIPVYWAGYSQVKAALKLIHYTLNINSVKYLHLISAECFPLMRFSDMEDEWAYNPGANYIESHIRSDNAWRVRTWMPHADSKHMRTFWGRVLKRLLRMGSYVFNTSRITTTPYYGSLWFSITRNLAEKIINIDNTTDFFKKFSRITCSDEHAFAMFVREYNVENIMDNNKRYIVFPEGASNPSYIEIDKVFNINNASSKRYWFARKVKENSMLSKIKEQKL